MTHTPGKLAYTENQYEPNRYSLGASGKWLMGVQHNGEQLVEVQRENMSRLVACWNACDGINTDLLERHPAPFSELRAQRDDLFAALVRLVRQHGSDGIEYSGDHPIAVARAAIAKATGV